MRKTIHRHQVDLNTGDFDVNFIPPLLQRIYLARGVSSMPQLDKSLQKLHPYHSMKGINEAVDLLVVALKEKQRILVVGDFDVDGATSSALAVQALRELGAADVHYLVPNRFEFGYGLTPEIVHVAAKQQPDVIMTVDNGISSLAGVEAAKALGIKVLITDHHLPGAELPEADAIVNPNQPNCPFPSKPACGCAVVFYLLTALRAALREQAWFQTQNIAEPNMGAYLDLVCLATVADVVPLDDNNRIFVDQGIKRIRAGKARAGILALLEIAGKSFNRLVASDLGFAIGPRLNAAGRLDDMSLGIECLMCDDLVRAKEMAVMLDELNQDRKLIESQMQREAIATLERLSLDETQLPKGVCLYDADWHQGVIGILASRIKDRLHRPVIAFAKADNGEIKGSARSIPGIHIRDVLDALAARYPGLLLKFGGHAMAAGMSLSEDAFPKFSQAFDELISEQSDASLFEPIIYSDGELTPDELNLDFAQLLSQAGPWGQNFPEPTFDGCFQVISRRILAEKHLKLVVKHPMSSEVIDAIAFNIDVSQAPSDLDYVNLAFKLTLNEFRGRVSPQLLVEYFEQA